MQRRLVILVAAGVVLLGAAALVSLARGAGGWSTALFAHTSESESRAACPNTSSGTLSPIPHRA